MTHAARIPEISVIIPVGARHSDLRRLHSEYLVGLRATGRPFEMIWVIDGPQTGSAATVLEELVRGENLTAVSLTRCFGEATAIMAGFAHARGELVLTLPAYHQIDAAGIPSLVAALDELDLDLALARRSPRIGNAFERLRRAAFHGMVGLVSEQGFHDLGCGARAMRRQVLEEIVLYGDQHRFLPLLALRQGFRVGEVGIRQSPADRFPGVYAPREYANGLLDIFTMFFLVRFTKKPLRFFGTIGASTFGIGMLLLAWLVFDRLVLGHALADRPALLLSSLLVVLGLQVFALGLLGELVIFTHAREVKDFQIAEVIEGAAPEARSGAPGVRVATL